MHNYLSLKKTIYILGVLTLFPLGKLYSQYLTGDYYSYFPDSKHHYPTLISKISFLSNKHYEYCRYSSLTGYSSNKGTYKIINKSIYFYKDTSSNQIVTYSENKNNYLSIQLRDIVPYHDSFLVVIQDSSGNLFNYMIRNILNTSDDMNYPLRYIKIIRKGQGYSQNIVIDKEIKKFSQIDIDIVNVESDSEFPWFVNNEKYRVRRGGKTLKIKYSTFRKLIK